MDAIEASVKPLPLGMRSIKLKGIGIKHDFRKNIKSVVIWRALWN